MSDLKQVAVMTTPERQSVLRMIDLVPQEPMTVEQFIAFINEKRMEVPANHAEDVRVVYTPDFEGDHFNLEWESPETDEELKDRLQLQADYAKRQARERDEALRKAEEEKPGWLDQTLKGIYSKA